MITLLKIFLSGFSLLSTVAKVLVVVGISLPAFGLTHYLWGEWQYHEGRVFERSEVARVAKKDAAEWAAWIVQTAVDDADFAMALEKARQADMVAQKGIDSENVKAPRSGPFISAEFMRKLDKLRP